MQDETTEAIQYQDVKAKRTAKNSVFVDLFQNKHYLLKLYKTLHPEDITATENSLTDVTIENVLTDNLYNDLGFIVSENIYKYTQIAKNFVKLFLIAKKRSILSELAKLLKILVTDGYKGMGVQQITQ